MRARKPEEDGAGVVAGITEPVSLSMAFDRLEAAAWSPHVFAAHLPLLLAQRSTLAAHARTGWLVGMRAVAQRAWALPDGAREAWMTLLAEWSDWPLLLAVAGEQAAGHERPDPVARLVAHARFQLGEHEAARDDCTRALLLSPGSGWATETRQALIAWDGFLHARAGPIDDGTLRLEPLGHHHCAGFAWQYWDPDIARLCCLPAFRDDDAWHRWLDECWGYGDQRLYAVLDREWGFVGGVSLAMHDDLGFFYYWVGRDFQGQGIGTAAVRLLLADAFERQGMSACYAKVFEDNAPSRRALAKLGFEALDFRPAPPHADEMLYRLGPPQARWRSVEALRGLFERMGSEARIAVPQAPAAWRR